MILRVFILMCVWVLVARLRNEFVFPKGLAIRARRALKLRLRFMGSPILCNKHATKLKPGQMAILDAKKCEYCKK